MKLTNGIAQFRTSMIQNKHYGGRRSSRERKKVKLLYNLELIDLALRDAVAEGRPGARADRLRVANGLDAIINQTPNAPGLKTLLGPTWAAFIKEHLR